MITRYLVLIVTISLYKCWKFCYCFQVQCIVEIWTAEVVEYNVSYVYHSLFAYFDRDNVPLKGLAKFFKEYSDEEREHAIKYQRVLKKSMMI
ncbi:ferritin-3, chloroplastic-like isoform X4 [Trifolium pratense]|uniref:ferritin-3, chloroplastic-like isoform X4 n=1 Tax=Trifolium pratense TaxID=57577 RepID=UPI001E697AFD|nr:ferritin-3, chloroplastic-like isoform X4 [Trifolium pratense]XP_045829064.1 ferritin-3, chloroplastic-like isoform X4 [Trifolium pratense]